DGFQKTLGDASKYTDDRMNQFRNDMMGLLNGTEDKLSKAETSLGQRMSQVDTDVRQALADELAALCERIDKEFTSTRTDMTNFTEAKSQEVKAPLSLDLSDSWLDLAKACGRLEGHHSRSTLPSKVREALLQQDAAMPPWQCQNCQTHCKASAEYCAACGSHWSYKTYAPRHQQSRTRTTSPGRHNQSPRPRRRGKGAQGKGQPQAAKPKEEVVDPPTLRAPALEGLPAPPSALPMAAPKSTTASSSAQVAQSVEKQQLDTLLKVLRTSKAAIPAEAQALLEQYQQSQTEQETKSMHRAVSQQSAAKRELDKLKTARSLYLQQWSQYIAGLAELLKTQIAEQETVMQSFDDKEEQWKAALTKASAELKALTTASGSVQDVDSSDPGEDDHAMQVQEELVEKAIEEERAEAHAKEAQRQQNQKVQATLDALAVQAKAKETEDKRDGSRTPRRQTPQPEPPAPAASGKGGGKAAAADVDKAEAVPGKAR
ncbi:unnamed protein product, partial [Symbiodinium sp. CCMP2456]